MILEGHIQDLSKLLFINNGDYKDSECKALPIYLLETKEEQTPRNCKKVCEIELGRGRSITTDKPESTYIVTAEMDGKLRIDRLDKYIQETCGTYKINLINYIKSEKNLKCTPINRKYESGCGYRLPWYENIWYYNGIVSENGICIFYDGWLDCFVYRLRVKYAPGMLTIDGNEITKWVRIDGLFNTIYLDIPAVRALLKKSLEKPHNLTTKELAHVARTYLDEEKAKLFIAPKILDI